MFIRYPGSKAKLRRKITDVFPESAMMRLFSSVLPCYCEPFFGSGAIGWEALESVIASPKTRVIINDIDPGIACLWKAVRDEPERLCEFVFRFEPSAEKFYQFKKQDGEPCVDPTVRGFRKLALHQMSFSGLGAMSGGPLGGKHQGNSKYNPSCRWNPERIVVKIRQCSSTMQKFRQFDILNQDFGQVLESLPAGAFVYLDPPYYVQGAALYKHAMSEKDHERLASLLRQAKFRWVLSYDDHPRIRELYSWAIINNFEMTPTMQTAKGKRRKNREIVIRGEDWFSTNS